MAWPINKKAEEMYGLYKKGHSLYQVGLAYGRTRSAVFGLFKYRGWPLRSKKKLPYIVFNGRRYTRKPTGYFARTASGRLLLHRDVWEFHKGKIPKGWDIHHIDLNRENNSIENLECLLKAEHTKKYSPHHNQYTRRR